MKRLTNKKEADAQREAYEKRMSQGYPRNIQEERFLRLAAYEDTGMEPEEIMALISAPKNPLTLEELREMDGEQVLLKRIGAYHPEDVGFAIVIKNRRICEMSHGYPYFFESYGESWLAYRKKTEEA